MASADSWKDLFCYMKQDLQLPLLKSQLSQKKTTNSVDEHHSRDFFFRKQTLSTFHKPRASTADSSTHIEFSHVTLWKQFQLLSHVWHTAIIFSALLLTKLLLSYIHSVLPKAQVHNKR